MGASIGAATCVRDEACYEFWIKLWKKIGDRTPSKKKHDINQWVGRLSNKEVFFDSSPRALWRKELGRLPWRLRTLPTWARNPPCSKAPWWRNSDMRKEPFYRLPLDSGPRNESWILQLCCSYWGVGFAVPPCIQQDSFSKSTWSTWSTWNGKSRKHA